MLELNNKQLFVVFTIHYQKKSSIIIHRLWNRFQKRGLNNEKKLLPTNKAHLKVDKTHSAFESIAQALTDMNGAMLSVEKAQKDISIHHSEIVEIMTHLSSISEENAAGTEEASAAITQQVQGMKDITGASEELKSLSSQLTDHMKHFLISDE